MYGKNIRSGIGLFLGLKERGGNYKYVQPEIPYVPSQYKGIYSNEKNVARILGQGLNCSWAWEKEEATRSMCSLRYTMYLASTKEYIPVKKCGKNIRSGIGLFLGLGEREGNYKYVQLEMGYIVGFIAPGGLHHF